MKKWQIAVSILLVFALGTAAGAYGSRIIFKKRVSRVLHSEGTPGITVIERMLSHLDLSEAQRTSIKAILDENNKKWETIREEYEPQIKELYEAVIEEAKKELTDEQREEMEQMSAKVQRRLPPRTTSPPHGSNQPESSVPPGSSGSPYGATPPEASDPSETSAPPEMSQPFGPKSDSDRAAEIMGQLQLDESKSATVRSIIESDIRNRDAMRDAFDKSQAAAEEKYMTEAEDAKIKTEKELAELLTPEQMEVYRQLRNPEEPMPEGFGFDTPGEEMPRQDFKQESLQNQPKGQKGKNLQNTWTL